MRRLVRLPVAQDTALAVLALATELPSYWSQGWPITLTEVVIATSIALRRTFPFPAGAAFALAFAVQPVVAVGDPPSDQLCLIAVVGLAYAFGSRYAIPLAGLGLTTVLAGGCLQTLLNHESDYAFVIGLGLLAWIPGVVVRQRQLDLISLRASTAADERERMLRERAAGESERRELARELHDVVSHSVSAMIIQTAAAKEVLHSRPEKAEQALDHAQAAGQAAIAELHRLLSLLVPSGLEQPTLPAPGLAALPVLIDEADRLGQHVELTTTGLGPLPPALELSVFRIVQEALTNARKYAGEAKVRVSITLMEGTLRVMIDDDGTGRTNSPRDTEIRSSSDASSMPTPGRGGHTLRGEIGTDVLAGGRGLTGLQERVTLFGGKFTAGPSASGFTVCAEFPGPK